jgi:hypothetical protein
MPVSPEDAEPCKPPPHHAPAAELLRALSLEPAPAPARAPRGGGRGGGGGPRPRGRGGGGAAPAAAAAAAAATAAAAAAAGPPPRLRRCGGSPPICRGYTLTGRRWGRRLLAAQVGCLLLGAPSAGMDGLFCSFPGWTSAPPQPPLGQAAAPPRRCMAGKLLTRAAPPPRLAPPRAASPELSRRVHLSGATLVVVPGTLIPHWRQQIAQHVQAGLLRVAVLDGSPGDGGASARRARGSALHGPRAVPAAAPAGARLCRRGSRAGRSRPGLPAPCGALAAL